MALFNDPVGWSHAAVATWPKFLFTAVMLVALQFALVHVAVTGGWRAAISLAALLAGYQLMFLYAMRRLLVELRSAGAYTGLYSGRGQ